MSKGTDLARSTEARNPSAEKPGPCPMGILHIPLTLPKSLESHNPVSPHSHTPQGSLGKSWLFFNPKCLLCSGSGQSIQATNPRPRYLLLPTPFHTYQLPWPAFCEFLGTQNAGSGLEENMEKAHRYRSHPSQQASIFFLPIIFGHKSQQPGSPSCHRCFIVPLFWGRLPCSPSLRDSLYLSLIDERT